MERVESLISHSCEFTPLPDAGVEEQLAVTRSDVAPPLPAGRRPKPQWNGRKEGGTSMARSAAYRARLFVEQTESPGEDSVLIKRLSAGDEEALGTLMDRYGGALLHFAHRLVGDLQLAEEIYQDTMLKAWQQAASFRLDGHLKAWLFRVARNNAIDYMRKKRLPLEEFTTCLETAATTFRPEREAERSWLSAEVVEAMSELPPAYREVVDLRFFHQLCYQEIAQVLGIPLGTVKSRLNYAIQRLTKILRERGIDHNLVES
ncbi:MAG: polymerase ECF-type sigma factor [Symbiobacteriaceae bacterium]|nr:polymerase ECF-type sigma factor [Symbiobacteriaceae bacterium]